MLHAKTMYVLKSNGRTNVVFRCLDYFLDEKSIREMVRERGSEFQKYPVRAE